MIAGSRPQGFRLKVGWRPTLFLPKFHKCLQFLKDCIGSERRRHENERHIGAGFGARLGTAVKDRNRPLQRSLTRQIVLDMVEEALDVFDEIFGDDEEE